DTRHDAPGPVVRRAHELRGKTCCSCSWLHSLKNRSLLKTRCDSGCGTTCQYKRQKQQAPVVFHRSSSRGYPLKRALSRAHQVSAARRLMGKLSNGRCGSAVCSSRAKSLARTVRSKVGTLMPLALT